jgi:hypothetical protein
MYRRLAVLMVLPLSIAAGGLAQPQNRAGTATIRITGLDFSVAGDYPTTSCGGPHTNGEGMAYQVKAGEYEITIASDVRSSGAVPLSRKNNTINVVATLNGKGKQMVRGPRDRGKLTISSDYRKAEATLELRSVTASDTATVNATFRCN